MVRPIFQSAIAGISAASERFDRSAAQLTRLAGAPSAAETADTAQISSKARALNQANDSVLSAGLEGSLVDMRVAKYAFIANLRVLSTGAEMEDDVVNLAKKS